MKKIALILSCIIMLSGCGKGTETISTAKQEEIQQISLDGLSNEAIGWGIKKNKGAPPDVPSNVKTMLSKYKGIYMGDTESKKVYLTFDEGYENGYTADILDTLKKNNVKAAFFITGDYAEREEKLVKRMVKEGHIIGNHSMNHPSLPQLSVEETKQEMKELDDMVEKMTGIKMKYVRPPRGEYSEKVLANLYNQGYTCVFWSFAYMDWDVTTSMGADYAFNQIMPYIHGGCVLLLHAVSGDNAGCLERLIKEVRNAGYEFGTLDELI